VASKFGLGKGLDALLPPEEPSPEESLFGDSAAAAGQIPPRGGERDSAEPEKTDRGEFFVSLDLIDANPAQPRKTFDEAALGELADSIREHGVIQPIIVEKTGGGRYTIVAGERRCRAARHAGLGEVPVLLREYSDEKRIEISLIENIQRADLNPVEEAAAYRHLMETSGLSQDEVAIKVGKNRSTVTNALRLLRLPLPMLGALESGAISPGHARALLSVRDSDAREELYRGIISEEISVREAEKRAALLNGGETPEEPPADAESAPAALPPEGSASPPETRSRDPHLAAMEQEFIETLGNKVVIAGTPERGTIRIDYYSLDDLNRLYELLIPARK
jgi:ParB family chromosome partitioning protein